MLIPSSGIYTARAPTESPAMVARYPDRPPCVSMTKTRRRDDEADCLIASQNWVKVLRQVSLPREYSVPGTLLDTVAGRTTRGILKASYCARAFLSSLAAVKASKPPMRNRASNLYSSKHSAVFFR